MKSGINAAQIKSADIEAELIGGQRPRQYLN
jgi:hypothetical protein